MDQLLAKIKIEELKSLYLLEEDSEKRMQLEDDMHNLIAEKFKNMQSYFAFRDKTRE